MVVYRWTGGLARGEMHWCSLILSLAPLANTSMVPVGY